MRVEEGGWVRCWGGHSDVGDLVRNTPSEDFVEVSVSRFHSCGVREDGAVVCWGSNTHGEQSSPWGERFTSVSTGHRHSCALRPDHTVACWGDNAFGQATAPGQRGIRTLEVRFASISSGSEHACGLLKNGEVVCWRYFGEG